MPEFPSFLKDCKCLAEKQLIVYKAIKKLTKYSETKDIPKIKLYLLVIIEGLENSEIKASIHLLVDDFLKLNLIETVTRIIIYVHTKNVINDDILYPIMRFASTIVCNVLELSKELCYQVIKNKELIDVFIGYLTDPNVIDQIKYLFSTEFRKLYSYRLIDRNDRNYLKAARYYSTLITSYFIIHNINTYIDVGDAFNDDNLKRMITKAIDLIHSDYMGISAYSTLAVIVKDDEIDLLNIGERYAKTIVDMSRFLVRKDENVYSEFRLWEVLNWCYLSLRNELMFCNIIKAKFIDVIIELFDKVTKTEKDIRYAKLCIERIFDECFGRETMDPRVYTLRSVDLTEFHNFLSNNKVDEEFQSRLKNKMDKLAL